jgi:catechol 2,3-dioxygenase-like lactoylglutathione lyase family enzyme
MVTKMSHTSLFVENQDKAFEFYVKKLGFKVNTDFTMENGFRWLTLNAPDQPDLEIVLFPINHNNGYDEETNNAFRLLLKKNALGAGALYTADCRATYEELKAKGVDITEPKEQFYGIECIVKDGCGNWFSMTQPKPGM